MTVKLLYCYTCLISTTHRKDENGNWVDWLKHVNPDPDETIDEENPVDVAYMTEKQIEHRMEALK